MRGVTKLFVVQLKLFLREPVAFFFTLVFPSMLLVFFAELYSGRGPAGTTAADWVGTEVPGLAGILVATVALMGIPIATTAHREFGVLRRYRATPLSPTAYLAADVSVYYVLALSGLAILFVVGRAFYGLHVAGSWPAILAGFTLCAAGFFASGYLIASVAGSSRTAQTTGQLLFFPMMFLSGATIPLAVMPPSLRAVSDVLPLTHAVNLLRGLWSGEPWSQFGTETAVMGGLLVGGVLVSAKMFKWE